MSAETEKAAPQGLSIFSWLLFAFYGVVGREVGAWAAYTGAKSSGKPVDFGLTPHTMALQAGRDGMLPGAIAASIAGLAALGLSHRRCGGWSIAIGLAVAAVAGVIAGFCSGHF